LATRGDPALPYGRRTNSLKYAAMKPSLISPCRSLLLAALASLSLSACLATKAPRSYLSETFSSDTPFQYYSNRDAEGACEIGKRALLSQGYQSRRACAARNSSDHGPTRQTA
jgi:hypothetical protein